MTYLYHVTGKDIPVYHSGKRIKDLSKEDVLKGLASDADQYLLFRDLETAKAFALVGQKNHPNEAFPVLCVFVKDNVNLEYKRVNSNGEVVVRSRTKKTDTVYQGAFVNVGDVTIFAATLKHISEKFDDLIFDLAIYKQFVASRSKAESKNITTPVDEVTPPLAEVTPPIGEVTPPIGEVTPPVAEVTPPVGEVIPPVGEVTPPVGEVTQKTWLDTIKKMAPLAVIGSVGGGFWASGAVQGVVLFIANVLNVAVPAAGVAAIAAEVAVAAVVGLAAYATLLAAQTVLTALWHAGKTAVANYRKSAKEKNDEEKASLTAVVQALETELKLDDALVNKFAELVKTAPDDVYAENGELAKPEDQPKELTQLQVLRKEQETLAQIKAANDDTKRQELVNNVTQPDFKFKMS